MKLIIVPILVVAIGIGFAAGRFSAPTPPSDSKPSATSAVTPASEAATPDPRDAALATLKATVARQEEELKALQKKKAEEKPAATPVVVDAPDPNALPSELWALVKNMTKGKRGKGDDQMKAFKLIGELKPEHAAYFIAKFKESEEREQKMMALMCAALSGGTDASNFVAAMAVDASLDAESRRQVLQTLGSGHGMPNRLVLTDSLVQLGDRFATSGQEDERAASMGILGMKPRDAHIEEALRNAAVADTSDTVKGAALSALARNGSPETLAWLKDYKARLTDAQKQGMMQWQLDQAIAELEKD